MKHFVFIASFVLIPFSFVSAQEASSVTGSPELKIVRNEVSDHDQAIREAMTLRQKLYFTQLNETREEKNIYYTFLRAMKARKDANVQTSINDPMTRTGEFAPRKAIRAYQEPNPLRANAKQVFRRCAINYYVEGGNCSFEDLEKDIIFASTYKVPRAQEAFWTRDMETISKVRDMQRNLPSWKDSVPTGQQGIMRSKTEGSSVREFMSPFTRLYFNPKSK